MKQQYLWRVSKEFRVIFVLKSLYREDTGVEAEWHFPHPAFLGDCTKCQTLLSDRTRSSGHKLNDKKCHLNMRKNFFTLRVAEHWERLPREGVDSPSLETFQTYLDVFLLPVPGDPALAGGGLDWMISGDPFQPEQFCDSVHL